MAAKVEGEVERVQEVGGKGRGSGSLLMNLAAKRAEVEEEYVEKEYVAEEEVERFQDLENVKVVSENGKGITRRNANANERVLSWRETCRSCHDGDKPRRRVECCRADATPWEEKENSKTV